MDISSRIRKCSANTFYLHSIWTSVARPFFMQRPIKLYPSCALHPCGTLECAECNFFLVGESEWPARALLDGDCGCVRAG
jgi:hypothetical protein